MLGSYEPVELSGFISDQSATITVDQATFTGKATLGISGGFLYLGSQVPQNKDYVTVIVYEAAGGTPQRPSYEVPYQYWS